VDLRPAAAQAPAGMSLGKASLGVSLLPWGMLLLSLARLPGSG
jgi:hypothetical protein